MQSGDEWTDAEVMRGKVLCLDGLNFAGNSFGFVIGRGREWSVNTPLEKVESFVAASKRAGVEVVVFIDAGTATAEATEKWMSRRKREVTKGERRVPQGNSVMLGDVFGLFGVKVVYNCPAFDLDDVLASYAHSFQGNVLSADNDFFRYSPRKFEVFGDFRITRSGVLQLKRALFREPTALRPGPAERACVDYNEETMRSLDPSFYRMSSSPKPGYFRGASCSLVRFCGNAHGKVAPLRAALWAHLGVGTPVEVMWPDWDVAVGDGGFQWHKGFEEADPSMLFLFKETPDKLLDRFFGAEKRPAKATTADWKNHLFACRAIVTELWLRGQPNDTREHNSLFALLQRAPPLKAEKQPCKFFARNRRCDYGNTCKFKHI